MARSGWEDIPAAGKVRRPSLRSGRVWEALLEGWQGTGGPPEGPVGVGRPSRRAGRG